MSIKGFPSQQKRVEGQSSQADFVTVLPSADLRNGLDTVTRSLFRIGAVRTAGASTGNGDDKLGTYVEDTATTALVGDVCRFEDGNMAQIEASIIEVETNGFRLAIRAPSAYEPASGDTFHILRFVTNLADSSGQASFTAGPIQYQRDGNPTEVYKDTAAPNNTRPLPVSAQPPRYVSEDEITNLSTVMQTISAPLNSVGFKIQAPSSNSVNIRMKILSSASSTSGFVLEPGRSEDFPVGLDITVAAESGTNQAVFVQWYMEGV